MPNFESVVYFLVVDFGWGCRSSRSSCCDRGKTKSTPSPFDLNWNGLGLEFDNISSIILIKESSNCSMILEDKITQQVCRAGTAICHPWRIKITSQGRPLGVKYCLSGTSLVFSRYE